MKRFAFIMMLLVTLCLQACGQSTKGEETAQSFASFTQEPSENIGIEDEAVVVKEQATVEQEIAQETLKEKEIIDKVEITKANDIATDETIIDAPNEVSKQAIKEAKKEATTVPVQKDVVKEEPTEMKISQDSKLTESSELLMKEEDMIEPRDQEQMVSKKKDIQSGVTSIGWSEFFDGEDQTTPSDRFWDLKGSTVTIKGFMGEVLSFDKHWFLLIPEPGAECPFDNGDETYWNKIMIVFVPDDVKLRYHSGPIQITGRLDTGIKIDESSYKTMFRIYDATFEEMNE